MAYQNSKELYQSLRIDCEKCFGLCCVALYFSTSEGFPTDKAAGKPCINLRPDFKCAVHKELKQRGLKGCTAFDCFGAGQMVSQVTYGGRDWNTNSEIAKQMFDVFLIVRQLHEMLWYLAEILRVGDGCVSQEETGPLVSEIQGITNQDADTLIGLDLAEHRNNVNNLFLKTSERVRARENRSSKANLKRKKTIAGRLDLIGLDLRKVNLKGEDLRGALLIAADLRGADLSGADLIGADLRDADLRGANFTNSIFLTQGQINSAKGDSETRLPETLSRPGHWEK